MFNATDATCSMFIEHTSRESDWVSMFWPELACGKSVVNGIGVDGGPMTIDFVGSSQLKHRLGSHVTMAKFTS